MHLSINSILISNNIVCNAFLKRSFRYFNGFKKKNKYSAWFSLPSKNQAQCKWLNVGRKQTDIRKKKKSATGKVFLISSHWSFCLFHSFPSPCRVLLFFALLKSDFPGASLCFIWFLKVLMVPVWLWEKQIILLL